MIFKNNNLLAGLLTLLFVVSITQSYTIVKISKNLAENKVTTDSQLASTVSTNKKSISQFTQDAAFVEEMKRLYPQDYQKRIQNIETKVNALLIKNGLGNLISDSGQEERFLRRFFCWLMGGTYIDVGNYTTTGEGIYMCVHSEVVSAMDINNDDSSDPEVAKLFPSIALSLQESNNNLNNLIYRRGVADDQYFKEWNLNYKTKLPVIEDQIKSIFADEGVNVEALGGPWFRRFLCWLSGGEFYDFSMPLAGSDDHAVTGSTCLWGFQDE